MSVLIFSGGLGLGAFQAGAYERLSERDDLQPKWIAGSSVGAVNAAIIAGNSAHDRTSRLKDLWRGSPSQFVLSHEFGYIQNWASAVKTRLTGKAGHFSPRITMPWHSFASLYDLSPLAERLPRLIDFTRLNSGDVRLTVATTDLESGELVLFDTARGDRIGPEHLLASCGFLPEFAPVEIDGRLLGDGGLSANAPIEALYLEPLTHNCVCFVIDLYARDGARPTRLEEALSRKNDLIFGNQTYQRLLAFQREQFLRNAGSNTHTIALYLSYRPRAEEAGLERGYDYSRPSLDARWKSGFDDMTEALIQLDRWRETPDKESCAVKPIRRAVD